MKRKLQLSPRRATSSGFSLIELLIAMLILTIGLLGGMVVIITAIASNARNRFDTSAVALAHSTMDRILALTSTAGVQTTQITDCNGTVHTISTDGGVAGAGAPLVDLSNISNGVQAIDFTQAPVVGYQMDYTLCAAGGSGAIGNPQIYDVRWNVSSAINAANGGTTQLVLVAAKNKAQVGNGPNQFFNMPVTLRALRGN